MSWRLVQNNDLRSLVTAKMLHRLGPNSKPRWLRPPLAVDDRDLGESERRVSITHRVPQTGVRR